MTIQFAVAAAILAAVSPCVSKAYPRHGDHRWTKTGHLIGDLRHPPHPSDNSWLEQNKNNYVAGTSSSASANLPRIKVKTPFLTLDGRLGVGPNWAMKVEAPIWNPTFRTDAETGAERLNQPILGDLRLEAIWTGLFKDRSAGLLFGLKLPTGDRGYHPRPSDIAVGTGTTDLLVGGYRVAPLGDAGRWKWFALGLSDVPLREHDGFRPGGEADGVVGVSWSAVGRDTDRFNVTPLVRLIGVARQRDSGAQANRANSGYERLLFAPGVKVQAGAWTVSGDVGISVHDWINGDQLVAPVLIKAAVSRRF